MSSEVDLCASILTFYRSDKAELVPPLQGADRSLAGVDGIGQGRHARCAWHRKGALHGG
jgi:hypothetical protein